ncbi:AAA family ATPase [Bacillus mycoides]|uniref:AAA family ATPase n=1 Tax=Bacillus mycoides TaxID=1405 RepID=UPI0025A2EF7A|nr:AAA family ATPase [Bacillus mycoides]MDM5426225.1 AAA family ATPase [Bacillus mycoides]
MGEFELQVHQRKYVVGKEVEYYILTGKINDVEYIVKVLANHEELASVIVYKRLEFAKKKGMELLLQHEKNVELEDIEMIHFKEDRPNGKPWQKDNDSVLKSLLNQNYRSLSGEIESYVGNKDVTEEGDKMMQQKNTILYGPPGTGKTYTVAEKALEIVMPQQYKQIMGDRIAVMEAYKKLSEQNRIAFCTFHQSFAYEDFVEGLRSDEEGKFILQDGIFKRICDTAILRETKDVSVYNFDENEIEFYKMSLGGIQEEDGEDIYNYCIDNNCIALGWGGNIDYKGCLDRQAVYEKFYSCNAEDDRVFNVDAINRFKNWMKKDDIIFISEGNHKIRAIAKVIGDYNYVEDSEIRYKHFREVEWLYYGEAIGVDQILKEKVLSQQTIYQFGKIDLNIQQIKRLLTKTKPVNEETDNYVLIIDEINRGNISKIFGELITLIEDDKRIDATNEIKAILPYSKKSFGIPSNLYIIGTMNTADRSISMMDTALRRRFHFEELMPQPNLLPEKVGNIEVQKMLKVLNERIEFLIDRNHTIGHAYFIKENLTFEELVEIMKFKVIPLLQEYFYEDWEKVELVLGGAGKLGDKSYFLTKEEKTAQAIFKTELDYDQTIKKYQLVENPNEQAFLNIYEG